MTTETDRRGRATESTPRSSGPLSGVRVVELGTVLMVPLAGQILGDLGADVIKVESLEGDANRQVGPGPHPDLSGVALNLNRNKRSIAVDLRTAEGREVLARITATADVFLTNLRPSALGKLRVRYEDVRAWQPKIVYCRSHGYGSDTPEADDPAYDDVVQASSGMASLSESVTGEPSLLPTVLADKVCGLTIVYAVLAALFERTNTGAGQEVEVPMFDTMLAFTLVEHLGGATLQPPLSKPGYERVLTPHRRPHRTEDGWIVIMPYSVRDWDRLWAHLGREDHRAALAGLTAHEVKQMAPRMYAWLDRELPAHSTAHWLQICASLDIAAAPVTDLEGVVSGPGRSKGVLSSAHHPVAGDYLRIARPVRFGSPLEVRHEAPLVGEDTLEILSEVGYSHQDVARFTAHGAIRSQQSPDEAEHASGEHVR
ncbi:MULTISPECIES: CaiB/BaiF CoA transferase family protein [Streptomyces]|uniref:CoA transferase n=1 Tax=Streptomyces rhizosphaericus TaxID=114699 RepID=A0A6G4A7B8_9ACTN|nr:MULTISPECIES: CoA transferase [Streptomyces]NEW69263.1 CoA transferase [Streptomyces rhizosphaericus]